MAEKTRYTLHYYGSVASVLALAAYGLENLGGAIDIIGLSSPFALGLRIVFWLGIASFVTMHFIAFGIRRFARGDPYNVLESAFTVQVNDPNGRNVRVTRERIFRPNHKRLSVMHEGAVFSDGTTESPIAELWKLSKRRGKLEQDHLVDMENNFPESVGIHRHVKFYVFTMAAPLERRSSYLHRLSWTVENGFMEDAEYFMATIVNTTKKVRVEIIPHADRPINHESVQVLRTQHRGVRNPTQERRDGIEFKGETLVWEKSDPEIGDQYQVIWSW